MRHKIVKGAKLFAPFCYINIFLSNGFLAYQTPAY